MRIQHTFAILSISYSIIHKIPIHPIGSCISRMTSVTRLPTLETLSCIVKKTFTRIFFGLHSAGIHIYGSHRQGININFIENICKIGWNQQLISSYIKKSGTVSFQLHTFTYAI